MNDSKKTKQELIDQLKKMRSRIAALENSRAAEQSPADKIVSQKYLNLAGTMLILLNTKGEITLLNKKGYEILGYEQGELIGENWFDTCLPEEIVSEVKKIFAKILKEGIRTVENHKNHIVRKDGERRIISWENTIVKDLDGSIVGLLSSGDDVTEEEKAKSAVKESEQKFRSYIENAPDGIFIADGTGRFVDINPSACEMTGYSRKELLSKSIPDILPENAVRIGGDGFEQLKKKEKSTLTLQYQRKDGEIRWCAVDAVRLSDDRYIAFCKDVTDVITSQQQLKDTTAFLDRIMEESPVPMWICNEKGLIIRTNKSLRKTLNLNDEKIVGKYNVFKDANLIEQGLMTQVRDVFDKRRSVRFMLLWKPEAVGSVYFPAAPELYLDVTMFPIVDAGGNLTNVVCNWFDITKNKIAQEKLKESEERYDLAMTATSDGIYDWNLQTNEMYYSPAWKRMLGYKDDELPNDLSVWERLTRPEDIKRSWKMLKEVINRKRDRFELEFDMKHKDGHWITVLSRASAVFDETRKAHRVVGTHIDMTRIRKAEKELEKYKNNLEKMVTERTRALEEANKELEAFSYSVSHDLRAPLRGIDGFSKILQEKYTASLDSEGNSYLNRVRKATQYMAQLIDDILQLSRITRQEIKITEINLSQLAAAVCSRLHEYEPAQKYGVTIAPGLTARADESLVTIVLQNLLGNAFKFSSGNKKASIEFGKKIINKTEVFFIKDNGVGFDIKYQDKLFEPFQRLHSIEEFPGTGIGLATVKRIVKKHGGKIWAEAEPDKGATFYFTLG